MEVLAKRLKWLREKERYSQRDIAAKINMTPSGYQKIEYGERDPKLDVIVALCDIYNVSADFLLGRDNTTSELEYYSNNIIRTLQIIESLKAELTHYLFVISELREKLLSSAQEKGFTDNETIHFSQELDVRTNQYAVMKEKLLKVEFDLRELLINYIRAILDIPESKPGRDKILKEYLPFDVNIQMNIFNEFEVLIVGEKIGDLGAFNIVKTEKESLAIANDLVKRLNSK